MSSLQTTPSVHVIHENPEWLVPLRAAFEKLDVPYDEVMLDRGSLDLSSEPTPGVYYNRMSASSHTRDHRYAAELAGAYLAWLEANGRRLVNSSRALRLEISKAAQCASLQAAGIETPRTVVTHGTTEALAAAATFDGPFIVKHNRGGKGLGCVCSQVLRSSRRRSRMEVTKRRWTVCC